MTMLKENPDIQFVRFWFADLLGNVQCEFSVPVYEMNEDMFKHGKGYDGSSVLGQARINESDKIAFPDPKTARILPWKYKGKTKGVDVEWREAVVFADIKNPDGTDYEGDCRAVLKKTLEKAKLKIGADKIYVGPELEYFLFESNGFGRPKIVDEKPVLLDSGSYFKTGRFGEIRKETQLLMQMMGYEFEYDHHEVAHSQHETDVRYLDALEMADFIMLYKYVVRRTAREAGLFASFMPKPIAKINGSGMHVHQSMFNKDINLFFDSKDEHKLSKMGKQYMAGLLTHIPEITSVLNSWVNSYKRLVPGYEAPVYICWDPQNRSNLIRKPQYAPNLEKATRLELRSPDPAANPYLAFAVMINAGIKGIMNSYDFPSPTKANVYEMNSFQRAAKGIRSLPKNLEEALKLTEQSDIVKETLGEHLFKSFIEDRRKHLGEYKASLKKVSLIKRLKNNGYKTAISPYEINELLPIL
ncbi:MAG: glutamine synthetase family protein [Nanoarchaeota archaeon]